jgi:hypothetical protein
MSLSRRAFVKSVSVGAAGIGFGANVNSLFAAPESGLVWTSGMKINPEIDNKKVVSCYDETMLLNKAQAEIANNFTKQNAVVNTVRVEKNLDAMAMTLTGKSTAIEAWKTIFRSSKTWAETKVAIKVNCIYTPMMPRVAIVGKICQEFNRLGVRSENITIYDACHGAVGNDKYTPYVSTATSNKGLPANVKISNGNTRQNVPVGSAQMQCTNVVLDSDILVNCAVNKGHGSGVGAFTMTMKNHIGTMKFGCPSTEELISINKAEAIIGGAIPRQQLCIIDSLWGAVEGPFSPASHLPARITMGTFGPMVDFGVATKIRKTIMNANYDQSAVSKILQGFSITASDLEWTEITGVPIAIRGNKLPASNFKLLLKGGNFRVNKIEFKLPGTHVPMQISILDMRGASVNTLQVSQPASEFVWNGMSQQGSFVAPGKYLIHLHGKEFSIVDTLLVINK